MPIDKKCLIQVKGRKVDINKLENVKLRRIFKARVLSGDAFLFNYGDYDAHHTDHKKDDYRDSYGDHVEYFDHVEHTEKYTYDDTYSDHSEYYD